VSLVHSLTELSSLQVSAEAYVAPKCLLQCKCCQHFGHTQHNCGYLSHYSCWQNTADRAVLNEEVKVMQDRRKLNAARGAVQPADLLCWRRLWPDLAYSRKVWDLDGATSSEGVVLRLLPHLIHKPLPGWSWKTPKQTSMTNM
jgi:hypothetical protein